MVHLSFLQMKLTTNKILSIIAHDLKDPLTSISGISDILITNWKDFPEEEKLDILNDIRDTSDGALKLLTELLDWSRKINAIMEPERKPFNAGRKIRLQMAAVSRKASWKKITLQNESPEEIPLEGDVNMFNAVFRNLLTNAIKSCHEGSTITVSAVKGDEKRPRYEYERVERAENIDGADSIAVYALPVYGHTLHHAGAYDLHKVAGRGLYKYQHAR